MLAPDEKITPKKWTEQKARLEAKLQESNPGYAKVVTELASAEVIEHKACYKIGQLVLVNTEILDKYLETFHITDSEFYK